MQFGNQTFVMSQRELIPQWPLHLSVDTTSKVFICPLRTLYLLNMWKVQQSVNKSGIYKHGKLSYD